MNSPIVHLFRARRTVSASEIELPGFLSTRRVALLIFMFQDESGVGLESDETDEQSVSRGLEMSMGMEEELWVQKAALERKIKRLGRTDFSWIERSIFGALFPAMWMLVGEHYAGIPLQGWSP